MVTEKTTTALDAKPPAAYRYRNSFGAAALELLARRLEQEPLDGRKFQVVSTVSDFEVVALPLIQELSKRGAEVRSSCFWVATRLLDDDRESPQEVSWVKAVTRDELDAGSYELIIAASIVGTVAELKSMAAHALYDQEHADIDVEVVTVISPLAHVEAEKNFKACLPERFAESCQWFARRTDPVIRHDGVLPRIGVKPFELAGFSSLEATFHYVPSIFVSKSHMQKQPNPGYRPTF